jgi:hypothetical protein
MADPVTLATMAKIATVVTAGAQVAGGIQAMQAGKAQAKVSRQKAEAEQRASALEERQHREQARRFRSTQLAKFAKAGVLITGTPLGVLTETAEQQERDALTIRYGGQVRKGKALSEASLAKQRGKQGLVGGGISAAGTILGGGFK